MRKIISFCICIFFVNTLFGQYDVHHTQFMHNKLSINPGYTGDREVFAMTALYRNQWFGIDGAPKTFTLHAHSPFMNKKNAIGLTIINDAIGNVNTSYVGASYAYKFRVSNDATLSIGIQGRVEHARIDWSNSDPLDQGDNTIPLNNKTRTNPNFGAGAYLSHEKYYIGLSVPTLLKTTIYDENTLTGVSLNSQRSYYLMGGGVMRLNQNVKFAPSVLFTYNPSTPFEMDLNVSFILMDSFWVGASYRLGDSVDGLLSFQINPQIRLGVAFDYTLTKLQEFSPGSFEILMDYNFQFKGKKINNIRYF